MKRVLHALLMLVGFMLLHSLQAWALNYAIGPNEGHGTRVYDWSAADNLQSFGGQAALVTTDVTDKATKSLRLTHAAAPSYGQASASFSVGTAATFTGIGIWVKNTTARPGQPGRTLSFELRLTNAAGNRSLTANMACDPSPDWQFIVVPPQQLDLDFWTLGTDTAQFVRVAESALSGSWPAWGPGDSVLFGPVYINPTTRPKFVICTDDGFAANLYDATDAGAYPASGRNYKAILDHYGFKGTAFIVPSLIGTDGHLSWRDLAVLRDAGWTIGSHSNSHPQDAFNDGLTLLGPFGRNLGSVTRVSGGLLTQSKSRNLLYNQPIAFSGALPSGLSAGTTYYVSFSSENTFRVSETPDGAPLAVGDTSMAFTYFYPGSAGNDSAIYNDLKQGADTLASNGFPSGQKYLALPQGGWDPYVESAAKRAGFRFVRGISNYNNGQSSLIGNFSGGNNLGSSFIPTGWIQITGSVQVDGTPTIANIRSFIDECIRTGSVCTNYSHSMNADIATKFDAMLAYLSDMQRQGKIDVVTMEELDRGAWPTITTTPATHGTITPTGSVQVQPGDSLTVTLTPDSGYKVQDVLVDGASVGAVGSYTFRNVTTDHAIAATFAKSWTITATAGAGGTISPATGQVDDGSSQTFAITPSSGYRILDVQIDGASVGPIASYTFSRVAANRSIAATFVKVWTITASAGPGGTISPVTAQVDDGSSQAFAIAPSSGYGIQDVLADGASVGAVGAYTFSNVTADHAITASFKADAPLPGGTSGTVSVAGQSGSNVTLTSSTPPPGASRATWSFGDGNTATVSSSSSVTHEYAEAGVYTVQCAFTDASGNTVGTTTTSTITVTSGKVEPSPFQPQDAQIRFTGETQQPVTADQLTGIYGVQDPSITPLRPASDFTALTSASSRPVVFRFSIYNMALEVAKLRLLKLRTNAQSLPYVYGSSATRDTDGKWWISDSKEYDIPLNSALNAAEKYYVNFVISDNGQYDSDAGLGSIHDPLTLAKSDSSVVDMSGSGGTSQGTTSNAASSDSSGGSASSSSGDASTSASSGGGGGGSGGGCLYDPAAGLSAELLWLLGAAVTHALSGMSRQPRLRKGNRPR